MAVSRFTRRTLLGAAAGGTILPHASRAQDTLDGRIAFVQDGNIRQWTPDGTTLLHADGQAMSPTWRPGENEIIYVRNGGSYSNLILLDADTRRTRRLTDSESEYTPGSQDYVLDCDWINDAAWSASDIVVFASTAESSDGGLNLWILRYESASIFPGPTDGGEPGPLEKVTVDAVGRYAAYTVVGDDMASSAIYVRDLDSGETTLAMEGAQGAFDAAISPDGDWVMGTIRDSDGMSDLWLWERDGGETTRLTHGEQASNAFWHPQGDVIGYLNYTGSGFGMRAFAIDFATPAREGEIIELISNATIDSTSRPSWNE